MSRNTKKKVKSRFSKEEATKLFNELFEFYGKLKILEPEFREYFKKYKHLSDEEIDDLWIEGRYEHKIINVGVTLVNDKPTLVIWRPEDLGEPPLEEQDKIDEILRKRGKGVFAVEL